MSNITDELAPWICVDGVEGAGKSTLAIRLAPALHGLLVAEFSNSPFGNALNVAVRDNPHFISRSPLGQSLVFLGDFIELYESSIGPARGGGTPVVSDRGYLSKYAYQYVVLSRTFDSERVDEILRSTLELLPPPSLTILLTAAPDVIRKRLLERDGHCSDERLDFIRKADTAARRKLLRNTELRHIIVDTGRVAPDQVLESATSAVEGLF